MIFSFLEKNGFLGKSLTKKEVKGTFKKSAVKRG